MPLSSDLHIAVNAYLYLQETITLRIVEKMDEDISPKQKRKETSILCKKDIDPGFNVFMFGSRNLELIK